MQENEEWSASGHVAERKGFESTSDGPSGIAIKDNVETNFNDVVDKFDDMNLKEELLRALYNCGFHKPSAIQQRSIVPFIKGNDVIALALSGTGKTTAASISILQQIDTSNRNCQALILTPSRYLAQHIQKFVLELGHFMSVDCQVFTDVRKKDMKKLEGRPHVIVGGLRRVLKLITRGVLPTNHIKMFILDEALEMLSLVGSKEKIHDIFKMLNSDVQMIISATMPIPKELENLKRKRNKKLQLENSLEAMEQREIAVKQKCFEETEADRILQNQKVSLKSKLEDLRNVRHNMLSSKKVPNSCYKDQMMTPESEGLLDENKKDVCIRISHKREVLQEIRNGDCDESASSAEREGCKSTSEGAFGIMGLECDIETNWNEVIANFNDMNLQEELLRGIYACGFEEPSAIQQRAIIPCIKGHHVIAESPPGTGKTVALSISILQLIDTSRKHCQVLVLARTLKLAEQIQKRVQMLGQFMNLVCHTCIGGTNIRDNIKMLKRGSHVVVGTPGRVFDMISRQALLTNHIKMFVLDEADKMLFDRRDCEKQIHDVFRKLNCNVQVVLFSDTMLQGVKRTDQRLILLREELKSIQRDVISLRRKYSDQAKQDELLRNPMMFLQSELKELKTINRNKLTLKELLTDESLCYKKTLESESLLNNSKNTGNVNLTVSQMKEIEKTLYDKLYAELKKNIMMEIMEELKNGTTDIASLTVIENQPKLASGIDNIIDEQNLKIMRCTSVQVEHIAECNTQE